MHARFMNQIAPAFAAASQLRRRKRRKASMLNCASIQIKRRMQRKSGLERGLRGRSSDRSHFGLGQGTADAVALLALLEPQIELAAERSRAADFIGPSG